MSQEAVNQAVREALGNDAFPKNVETTVNSQVGKTGAYDVDTHLNALKVALGTGTLNPNVEYQIRQRVKTLTKSQEDGKGVPPAPGLGGPHSNIPQANPVPDAGLVNTTGPYKGTDAGKPQRAVQMVPDGSPGVNAEQKAAFAKDGNVVKGGGNPAGPALSDVAAATNSGPSPR
jgi:hypothetical protein